MKKSNCPLVKVHGRTGKEKLGRGALKTSPSQYAARVTLAAALGATSFGGGLSLAVAFGRSQQPSLIGKVQRSDLLAAHADIAATVHDLDE